MLRLFQRHLERAQFRVVGVSVAIVRRKVESPFLEREIYIPAGMRKANLSENTSEIFIVRVFLLENVKPNAETLARTFVSFLRGNNGSRSKVELRGRCVSRVTCFPTLS